ncbi:MAG: carboxypeptidase-like regulatory domain-containing protein [Acidobacteriia bacterium]|nr:carboxypeptidase-like regulatory domain-containing protein [Terriglobia bacterium]
MPVLLAFLLAAPLSAAVTGTVINRTTGQPQPGATVGLNRLGQNGIELIDQAKSDAQGKFTINQEIQGPHLLRTAFDGVTYNHMLPPGSPTTGLTLDVFNASKEPGSAKVSKHMLLFEPSGGQMVINESYIYGNDGKTAWNDPDRGTLHFYAPKVEGKVTVTATAPGGMPIPAPVNKTSKPDVYAVDFSIKPGETRFDLNYTVPYTEGAPYAGKILTNDENTYLIAPNGITLEGANLKDMGTEPRTQAHIYGLSGTSYQIQLTGTEAAPPAAAAADGSADQPESSGPQIEQIMPRVNGQTKLILALAFGILALGFALLYRANPGTPKESNERSRH